MQIAPALICKGRRLNAQVVSGCVAPRVNTKFCVGAVRRTSPASLPDRDANVRIGPLVCGRTRFLFPGLRLQELDVHVGSVDADKFTSAVSETGGGQEQKELLEIEALDRTLDRQHGIV